MLVLSGHPIPSDRIAPSMLKTAFVAARDRQRLSEIATILIGFGVTRVVDRLGLRYLPLLPRRQPRLDVTRLSEPERLRRAIEALGPTFIKFGQVQAGDRRSGRLARTCTTSADTRSVWFSTLMDASMIRRQSTSASGSARFCRSW